ncbi:MAG: hypothetical protein VX122_05860 [Pseudomonadota bacterium]|nr:hypothetical protein [Pseudomonadota bacterium]
MSVNSFDPQQFDPSQASAELGNALVEQAISAAHAQDEGAQLCLTTDEVAALVPAITHAGWSTVAQDLSTQDLVALIRLFTLGEGQFSSWQAGAKSAVIKLVRVMKARKEMAPELTAWIKTNSDNRFLPHGDLMDRL